MKEKMWIGVVLGALALLISFGLVQFAATHHSIANYEYYGFGGIALFVGTVLYAGLNVANRYLWSQKGKCKPPSNLAMGFMISVTGICMLGFFAILIVS